MNKLETWKKQFYIIWGGQAVSLITSAILQMAIIFYITERTESAMVLSLASIAGFLPYALLGPVIGVYVDRIERKIVMIGTDLLIAAAGLVLAIAGVDNELSIPLILVILFVRSLATAFHTPAINALTPSIVPSDKLVNYSGITQSMQAFSYLFSPVLAAILYANIGISLIIMIDVVGAIIASIMILVAKLPKQEKQVSGEQPSVIGEMKLGFNILKQNKGLLYMLLVGTLYMVVYMPINSLYPLMSFDYFGGGAYHASITEVSYAIGMLLGGMILAKIAGKYSNVKLMSGSIVLMGLSLVVSGLISPNLFFIFVICCLGMGLSVPFYSGIQTGLFQTKIEEQYLGRVFALSSSLMTIAMPIGLIFAGLFADIIGVNVWFSISGIIIVIIGLIFGLIPAIKQLDNE